MTELFDKNKGALSARGEQSSPQYMYQKNIKLLIYDYNCLMDEMHKYVKKLEKKYGMTLPGSPEITKILIDFYNKDNKKFRECKLLVDKYNNLMTMVTNDHKLYENFMNEVH